MDSKVRTILSGLVDKFSLLSAFLCSCPIHLVRILPDGSVGNGQTSQLSQRVQRLSKAKESYYPFSVIKRMCHILFYDGSIKKQRSDQPQF